MTGEEMRIIRKRMAMTQYEMAERLGVSRKTVVGWEASTVIDKGIELRVFELSGHIRVLTNTFRVEPTIRNTYAVVHRRNRQMPHRTAMFYSQGEAMLMGEFSRRADAYRWCSALQGATNPRNTRQLQRERAALRADPT